MFKVIPNARLCKALINRITDPWTDRTEHAKLRSFTDKDGNFWLEQNTAKRSTWAQFAKKDHDVA